MRFKRRCISSGSKLLGHVEANATSLAAVLRFSTIVVCTDSDDKFEI
jgi:hypothetical protein